MVSQLVLLKTRNNVKGRVVNKKIELLAPAGDLEKLKIAIDYGADAVYLGGEMFSLRAGAGNFTREKLIEGIEYAHKRGKRVFLAMNIFPHNEDINMVTDYIEGIKDLGIDAFIVSDPGMFAILQEQIPGCEIHISTQANITNYASALFWKKMGASRIVLARELTLENIREIKDKIGDEMEIEAFVQGAMCISYSGRCLLSNFMIERDANKGECAHPCRWKYSLVEEQRPDEVYPVFEDERGTYIMNSRDLCLIEHVPELIAGGIDSFKIEGRMKSSFYVGTVVRSYRAAIDKYYEDKENYKYDEGWFEEIKTVSHREFTTGFYFNKPNNKDQNYLTSAYTRNYSFVGMVKDFDKENMIATVEQRNKVVIGEEVEFIGPYGKQFKQKLEIMMNDKFEPIESAPHPQQIIKIKVDQEVAENFMMRKKLNK